MRRRSLRSGGAVTVMLAVVILGVAFPAPVRAERLIPPAIHADFSGTVTTSQGGRSRTIIVQGESDTNLSANNPTQRARIESSDSAGTVSVVIQQVIVDGQLYQRVGDDPWRGRPLPDLLREQLAALNPETLRDQPSVESGLAQLEQAGINVTRLPEETVRDVRTNHYRFNATGAQVKTLIAALPAGSGGGIGGIDPATLDALPDDLTETVEQWIGQDDDFVYRTRITVAVLNTTTDVTYDYTPLSEPVEIVAPV